MIVRVAENAGFCPGVHAAVEKVYRLINEKDAGQVYIVGELIHNAHIVNDLQARGVITIEPEQLPAIAAKTDTEHPVTVVIRTHGVPASVSDILHDYENTVPGFRVLNCTCPFVKKIHTIAAKETDAETPLYVFGDPNHPEVKGIISYAKGEAAVVDPEQPVFVNFNKKNAVFVSQTTQSIKYWKNAQLFFKKLFTYGKIFDTICSVTENRQVETAALARQVDAMLVVGGKNSSNTKKLAAVAAAGCKKVFLIEGAENLPEELLHLPSDTTLGITAGASTPRSIIQEVYSIMSEIQTSEDFAQLLSETFKTLNTGDIVKGIVTSVSPNELKVDLSAKVTGIVPFDEITDDSSAKLTEMFHVGDEIEAQAFRVSDVDGVATLSIKRIQKILNWRKIVAAKESGEVLEGKVTEIVKGGVLVSCMFSKIFIPGSLTGIPKGEDLSVLKGQTIRFNIVEIDEGKNRAVGSMRQVLREERKANQAHFWETLEVGMKFTGKVKGITSFGVFVELADGVQGMVHVTELSWKRISNPAELVSIGDDLDVFVKSFNAETKHISLGHKTEETNPLTIFAANYQVGDVVPVKIVSLLSFGAFAEIIPTVEGLIHISQITDHKIVNPSEVLEVGQTVDAKIVGIEDDGKKKKRISLSIRALMEGEEDTEEAPETEEAPVEEAPVEEAPAEE